MKKISIYVIAVLCSVFIWSSFINIDRSLDGIVVEWDKFKDLRTGNEVWQLTSNDSMSEAFYFYAPSFTSDDKYVIFRSNRTGVMEVYRCDLTNGEIVQLTDSNVNNACIHPDGESVVYISGWKYYKMNVHTMKREVVVDFSGKIPATPFFRPSLTNDGKFTIVYTRQTDMIRLYRVNLETGEILMVMEQQGGDFSHQLINPVDPNLITYAPLPDTQGDLNLPMEKRSRARIIDVSKGTNEAYLMAPSGCRLTHDSWSPLGDRYFFFEKTLPDWTPASIASIDLNGKDYTRHHINDSIRLGHGAVSRDGKWFISDGQTPFNNPLILLNLEDARVKFLAWPDASIRPDLGRVHVHPNFSTTGNYVIYTSDVDKTGTHQVYVMPIRSFIDKW